MRFTFTGYSYRLLPCSRRAEPGALPVDAIQPCVSNAALIAFQQLPTPGSDYSVEYISVITIGFQELWPRIAGNGDG